ncbi:phage baseplate assembly protein V [Chromobacterium haemolyticum]|uniref:phage baseplate assembly protein V n=1 Tax=Chromobacterium haemolyticum TaxID=394935 RepID=UPI0009DA7C45|nr:phage baseplate assembly protein V [Chromobacterium haemolyticum]OQS37538.1 hypothetical protein B0T39_15255 [Chromobacterium haemolyticum]
MSDLYKGKGQSAPPDIKLLFGTAKQPLKTLALLSLKTRLAANQIPNAKLVLKQPGAAMGNIDQFTADAKLSQPGTPVVIQFADGRVLFSGVVAEQHCRQTQAGSEMTLRLCHPLQGAQSSHASQVFVQQTDKMVLKQLLQRYLESQSKISGLPEFTHPQLVQYECSDWQFIKARLFANGVWLWPDAEGGVAIMPPQLSAAKHTLVRDVSAQAGVSGHTPLVEAADWTFNSRELIKKIDFTTWNAGRQQAQTRQSSSTLLGSGAWDAKALANLGPQAQSFHTSCNLQDGEQCAWATGRLLALQAASVRGRFTVAGGIAYQLGDTLEVKGFGGAFDGKGVISGIEHQLTPGRWRTTLAVGLDLPAEADLQLLPEAPGLQIGVVADYQSDPDRLDQLRIKVPALGEELWARFASPYASKDSGVCFYPEPGDEVVLGFFGADPRFPVVLGSMHNPRQPSPIDPLKHRQQRGLILQANGTVQQLLFDGQAKSAVLQSDQDRLTLKTGITADSPQDIRAKGKNMVLQAEAKQELSGQQVKVKGSKVDVGM